MNSELMTMIASLAAAISVVSFTIVFYGMLEQISIDKSMIVVPKRIPIFVKLMLPFAPNVKPLVRMNIFDQMRAQVRELLIQAGYEHAITAENFIAVRLLLTLVGIFLCVICFMSKHPLLGIIIPPLMFIYPTAWLRSEKTKRHKEILRSLPNVLDLLTLSVQAGKDFLSSLKDILERRRLDALGEELGKTFQEIQLGKKRQVALRDLSNRVKLAELTSVINAIIQAEEMGVSIGQLLVIQGDQLRNKRFSQAEKLANEAPVKILFPVILFIFPSVFIILIGPMLLQALKQM